MSYDQLLFGENLMLEVLLPTESKDLPHLDQEVLSFLNTTDYLSNFTSNTAHNSIDSEFLDDFECNDLYSKHLVNNQSASNQENLQQSDNFYLDYNHSSLTNYNHNSICINNSISKNNLLENAFHSNQSTTNFSQVYLDSNSTSSTSCLESNYSTSNDFNCVISSESTSNSNSNDSFQNINSINCSENSFFFDYDFLDDFLDICLEESFAHTSNLHCENEKNQFNLIKLNQVDHGIKTSSTKQSIKKRSRKKENEEERDRKLAIKIEKRKLRLERKKVQNKEAARRYRERKRNEFDLVDESIQKLELHYNKLKEELIEIVTEKKVLLKLLKSFDQKDKNTKIEMKFPDWMK